MDSMSRSASTTGCNITATNKSSGPITMTTTTTTFKGKTKDDCTQSTLPSHSWNFHALVEQRHRSRSLPDLLLSLCFNSTLTGQSYGQVQLSSLPTKATLSSSGARSHHQSSFCFNPLPWATVRLGRMNRLQYSACHPTRIGCSRTSLVGKYLGWGASGELIGQTVGIQSNLLTSPAVEALFPLCG